MSLDIELNDVENVADPKDKVVAGLQSNGDQKIPLKAVHVRAKLQDLTSEVAIECNNNVWIQNNFGRPQPISWYNTHLKFSKV